MFKNYLEIKRKHDMKNKRLNELNINYVEDKEISQEYMGDKYLKKENDEILLKERNDLQVYLENQLDINSKLEDTVYKLKMNIKKLERDEEYEIEEYESIPSPPIIKPVQPRKVGRPKKIVIEPPNKPTKPLPPKVIKNVKIVSKNIA